MERLEYQPDTGQFTQRINIYKATRYKAGDIVGAINSLGYIIIAWGHGNQFSAHQLAWFYMTGRWAKELDHKNGIRSDNRWENLRRATRRQNCQNRKIKQKAKLGLKGVFYVNDRFRRKPYAAKIVKSGKTKYLGYFSTPEEAHSAYCVAANKAFGKFARTG